MVSRRDKQVIINIATSILRLCANVTVFIFVTPYIRKMLEDIGTGYWWFAAGVAGYLTFLYALSSPGITKYVAEYRAREDSAGLRTTISTGLWLHIVLMAVVLLFGGLAYRLATMTDVVRHSPDVKVAQLTLALVILTVIVNTPFVAISAVIRGLQRYDFLNILEVVAPTLRAAATVLLLYLGHGLIAVALCNLAVSLLSNRAVIAFAARQKEFMVVRDAFDWHTAKKIVCFGGPNFVSVLSNLFGLRSDGIVIATMISTPAVVVFGLGQRLFLQVLELVSAVNVLMPVASEISILDPTRRRRKIEELFVRGSRFGGILSLPIVIFLLIMGHDFIRLWQGPTYEYARSSYLVLIIILVPGALTMIQLVAWPIAQGLSIHRFQAYLALTLALVNLGLSLILARPYGIIGVAWGTAIPELIKRVILQFHFKKAFDISMMRYYWNVLSRLAPLACIYTGVLFLQQGFFHSAGKGAFFLAAVGNVLAFWLASYFVLDAYERKVVGQIFRRLGG